MSAEDNKAVVRTMLTGEGGDPLGTLADDVVWRIGGETVFSSTYDGKEDLLARLLGPLGEELQGSGRVVIDTIIGEGDLVAVQAHGDGRVTRAGVSYDNNYAFMFRVSDGRIVEVDEYCDTELITKAFGSR